MEGNPGQNRTHDHHFCSGTYQLVYWIQIARVRSDGSDLCILNKPRARSSEKERPKDSQSSELLTAETIS